ncbi:MAG: hypothetical protein ABI767_15800, partial [Rhodanobacter sp.]
RPVSQLRRPTDSAGAAADAGWKSGGEVVDEEQNSRRESLCGRDGQVDDDGDLEHTLSIAPTQLQLGAERQPFLIWRM